MEDRTAKQSLCVWPPSSDGERPPASIGGVAAESENFESGVEGSVQGALFVTRPLHISCEKESLICDQQTSIEWQILSHGIDTLDLGFYVDFDRRWFRLTKELEARKRKAQGRDTILWKEQDCLVYAGGKPPNYRWHLAYPKLHLFLAKNPLAVGGTPNVYVSLDSELLWRDGVIRATERVREIIASLGGSVAMVQVSRCDPCVDFLAPKRLTSQFLEDHRVPKNRFQNSIKSGDDLETYYNGAKAGEIQLRVYDKGRDTIKKNKLWFLDVWNRDSCEGVWRVEYQLRREALKQFGINELHDLEAKLPGVWARLTEDWFSLRLPDNANTTRRSVHPLWAIIQGCAKRFGTVVDVRRVFAVPNGDAERYVRQIAGWSSSYAAARGITDRDEALELLLQDIRQKISPDEFAGRVRVKTIKQGREAA